MTDKQKIKAEVEWLKIEYNKESVFRTVRGDTAREVLDKLLSFIDSMPEEPVSKSLERAADSYASTFCENSRKVAYEAYKMGAKWKEKQLMKELWHKGTDNPGNKHPYPVINPDTQEMAFAYYDQRFGLWEFDRDYNPGCNMLWLDIEKILPNMKGDEK